MKNNTFNKVIEIKGNEGAVVEFSEKVEDIIFNEIVEKDLIIKWKEIQKAFKESRSIDNKKIETTFNMKELMETSEKVEIKTMNETVDFAKLAMEEMTVAEFEMYVGKIEGIMA